ncbi:MAG TPA: sugar kinase [Amaricoccus sp.]|uniref:sugar kinase n=2 Tax=Amaricoccus sp. TaxID=1872485 RepID=UPI002C0E7761|nr:sugar kinase [Amaricoccus sp.]HMQ95340.1 sugar kinase [Amaricoccus sp.]HMR54731.1 sugar kinase [Amaricoccus sp.]HMU01913.1 sugar kinase [Amaricoccus sp.]
MTRVACIGECMVELTLPKDGAAARVGFAGDTLNTAIYLKRGAPALEVAYVTALGRDALSERMLAFFAEEGLDTGLIERRADRVPGLYAISTDAAGERSFTYWRESSAARTLFEPPAEVTPARLAGCGLVYLSGITLAVLSARARAALLEFIGPFRKAGGLVAFDSNYRPRLWPDRATAQREIAAFWAVTDIGLPSLDDEFALWGESGTEAVLARLASAGLRQGALKRGAEGPLAIGWEGALPGFPPAARVVDTTAAGDSFNGGYLAALLAGAPPPERLLAGHRLASEVIGHPGAIMPRRG